MINGYKIIALCINRVHDDESSKVVTALNKQLVQKGYRLFVYGVCSDLYWGRPDEQGEAAVFDLIDYDVIDALVVYEEKIGHKELVNKMVEDAISHGILASAVGNCPVEGCINVAFAYEKAFEQVVRHVVEEHGLKRLHFMAGVRNNEFSDKRMRVFQKVITENNIPFDDSMVSYGEFWERPTRIATEKLIAERNVPEAIICANDSMAIAVSEVLQNRGYRVPEDVIVTGFDGITEINFSIPKITSSYCCYDDLAIEIAELVAQGFDGICDYTEHLVVPRLILSESCGCAKRSPIPASKYLNNVNGRFYNIREGNRTLTGMASRVQISENLKQVAENLNNYMISDMCCLIKKECIDESIDPMTIQSENTFGETMCLLLDTDNDRLPVPRDFPTKDIIPGLAHVLEGKMPLIFAAIYFRHIPLGYVCFHYWTEQIDNFDKIAMIVNGLNNAIGGYRNVRYQRFLAKHIEEIYQLDALTGLNNRISFMKKYGEAVRKVKGKSGALTFILLDLDGLKYINDNVGHGD